jgi:tetratricopeptide (TPR) repeat protein
MIGTSVNPNDFSQIVPEERFNVDAPTTNPTLASSSLDVTRTERGVTFSVVERPETSEPLSVERTLVEMIARCAKDVRVHPHSTRSKLNLALALINGGKSDSAVEILREVLNVDPANYVALTSLALLFFNRGDLHDASEIYSQFHLAYPDDPAPLVNLASIALRSEDYIRASGFLQQAVDLDGCSVTAKYLLAMVLLRLGKASQSIALLRASLRSSGPSAELNQGLAIAYLVSGDYKRAERAFSTALAINKNMVSAVHGLALLRLQQHRLDDVVELLLSHLSHNSGDSQARELLARAYVGLGQFSRARGQLNLLIPVKADIPEEQMELARISNNEGFCFASEGKVTEAELWLKRSLQLDGKTSPAPYTNLGRLFLAQGRFEEGLGIIARMRDLHLDTPDSAMLKSALLINLRRVDQAIEVLQALIESGSAPGDAYAELGWLLADWKGEYDAAIAVFRKGSEKDPSNSSLLNNLAYVHLLRGEPAFARDILDQIGDISANPILLTATRGLLLLWEGDLKGGEELYKKAESIAYQSGLRDFAISVRQKRHLEMARAYVRYGQIQNALDQVQSGLNQKGGTPAYRHRHLDQLMEISRTLQA